MKWLKRKSGNREDSAAPASAKAAPARSSPEAESSHPWTRTIGDIAVSMPSDVAQLEGNRDVPALMECLEVDHPHVRIRALDALGKIGDPAAAESVARLLTENVPMNEAEKALETLVRSGPKGQTLLVEAAHHDRAQVRAAAIQAMRSFEGPGMVDAAAAALSDVDPKVRRAALDYFETRVGGGGYQRTVNFDGAPYESAVAPLLTFVDDDDYGQRNRAAEILGALGAVAIPALGEMVERERGNRRAWALYALKFSGFHIRDARVSDCLIAALADGEDLAADPLDSALWTAKNEERFADRDRLLYRLRPLLNSPEDSVRVAVGALLRKYGGESNVGQDGAKDQGGGEVVQRSKGSAVEELANFEATVERQSALLKGLTPIDGEAARPVFAAFGIAEPNRYDDPLSAFSGLRQYAMSAEGAPVQVSYLNLGEVAADNDFLYVHLADLPPLGFLVCALKEGGFLGYYKTGSALKEALGI